MMFRRFKAMVQPGMAGSYDAAAKVYARKSIWVVHYLRARRSGDKLIGFYRRKHFEEKCSEVQP